MKETANFLTIDLGASNGRVPLARWNGTRFELEELHRFANGSSRVLGYIYLDVLRIWSEILAGFTRYASLSVQPIFGVGADTWEVDFAMTGLSDTHLVRALHSHRAPTAMVDNY